MNPQNDIAEFVRNLISQLNKENVHCADIEIIYRPDGSVEKILLKGAKKDSSDTGLQEFRIIYKIYPYSPCSDPYLLYPWRPWRIEWSSSDYSSTIKVGSLDNGTSFKDYTTTITMI